MLDWTGLVTGMMSWLLKGTFLFYIQLTAAFEVFSVGFEKM